MSTQLTILTSSPIAIESQNGTQCDMSGLSTSVRCDWVIHNNDPAGTNLKLHVLEQDESLDPPTDLGELDSTEQQGDNFGSFTFTRTKEFIQIRIVDTQGGNEAYIATATFTAFSQFDVDPIELTYDPSQPSSKLGSFKYFRSSGIPIRLTPESAVNYSEIDIEVRIGVLGGTYETMAIEGDLSAGEIVVNPTVAQSEAWDQHNTLFMELHRIDSDDTTTVLGQWRVILKDSLR